MIRLYSPNLLDICLRHRLLVGDDRQRLHHHVRQHLLLWCRRHADQMFIIVGAAAHLVAVIETHDLHARLSLVIFLLQALHGLDGRLLIRFQRCRKLADLHRLPHGKQHGLHNGLLLFQIFHSHSFSSTVVFSYSYW